LDAQQLDLLWTAGQRRLERERQERWTAMFATSRDGHIAATSRKPYVPKYLQTPDPTRAQDVAQYRATLSRLGTYFPGAVKVN
jgi:hypothetical protein